ncbi:MAG: CBS domain-containing protein [Anaerolineae bacterium]|nr:CBS domain-containing protein [Anaerolineae bacterium]
MKRTARDLLRVKGTDIWSVSADATMYEALELMAEKNIGAVLVMDGDRLLGILSERDYARKMDLAGRCAQDTKVGEIMTERPVCVPPHRTVEEAMAVMTEKRVRHLPVIEAQRVVGLISIGDVVKEIISQQEFVIEQLENYITGTPLRPLP